MKPLNSQQLVTRQRPRVILLVGLPGSGKSTMAKEYDWPTLSSDELRIVLADDATNQTVNGRVFATLRYLLRHRLEIGCPVTCIDATSLTPDERRPYIDLAAEYGAIPEAVFFDFPVQICQSRNASRQRVVPIEAMEMLAARLVPPSEAEGFWRVIHVTDWLQPASVVAHAATKAPAARP